MRNSIFLLSLMLLFGLAIDAEAQFKNLGKKLKKKVDHRIERKIDRAADKGLDEVEEGIEDTVTGDDQDDQQTSTSTGSEPTGTEPTGTEPSGDTNATTTSADNGNGNTSGSVSDPGDFKVNTKFDYVPGSRLMVFDDFSADAIGDFPSRWNTNGTGEVVTFGDSDDKWFLMRSRSIYIPDLPQELPESYTIEFDVAARGLDNKTSSNATLEIVLADNNTFAYSKNRALVRIPFCQYHPIGFHIRNWIDQKSTINNNVAADIRQQVLRQPHVSIAVNKTRFRLWVNEKKYIDIPRLIAPGKAIKYIKFEPHGFKDGKEDIYIRNLKIAEGGLDLRGELLKEGKVSTNGILFDVNSANIKPESFGVIRQIALAMEESDIRLNIIGHTDSDGDDASNQSLSEKRAASVKDALVKDFGIKASRLETKGMGESQPVAENNSPEGKAANRRVEFITL